jgi:hydroxypyruvate isomerase
MQIMEGDMIRMIRQNVQHIRQLHTAGGPGGNELDETQELYYPPICRAIAATDYDGYVEQEFSPRDWANWATSLEAAYRVCDV